MRKLSDPTLDIVRKAFKSILKKKENQQKKLLNSEANPRQKQRQKYHEKYLRREREIYYQKSKMYIESHSRL